jgi:hypothetical protein
MPQQLETLVRDGLYHENLLKLTCLCEELFDQNPTLYAILSFIFNNLAEEYNGQSISTERYDTIVVGLQEPLLKAIGTQESSADDILGRLNDLLRAFKALEP